MHTMRPVVFRVRWWLRTHLGSVAGLALLVAIVGGMVLALAGGAARTLSAPDRYSSARGHEWDVSLQQEEGLPRLADLESLPSVRRVGLMTFVFGGLLPANGDEPIDALVFAGSTDAVAGRLVAGTFADPLAPT